MHKTNKDYQQKMYNKIYTVSQHWRHCLKDINLSFCRTSPFYFTFIAICF